MEDTGYLFDQHEETLYPFTLKGFEEPARLKRQSWVLDKRTPLPDAVVAHGTEAYRVLDLACGPGSWAINVARQFPSWHVSGLDISDPMISFAQALAESNQESNHLNVQFQSGNVLRSLPFGDESFDFVHARLLQCFMRLEAWPALLAECRRILRPNGYIQLIESLRPECDKPANVRLISGACQLWAKFGITGSPDGQQFGICPLLPRFLRESGFVVEAKTPHLVDYSFGEPDYPAWIENVAAAYKQLPKVFVQLGRSEEETKRTYEEAVQEMNDPGFCAMIFFLSVVARKP